MPHRRDRKKMICLILQWKIQVESIFSTGALKVEKLQNASMILKADSNRYQESVFSGFIDVIKRA